MTCLKIIKDFLTVFNMLYGVEETEGHNEVPHTAVALFWKDVQLPGLVLVQLQLDGRAHFAQK